MKLKSTEMLRLLMQQNDLSFAEVGRAAERDRTYIWQLADGRRTTCKPEVAERIAKCLRVPLEVLFEPRVSPAGQRIVDGGKRVAA